MSYEIGYNILHARTTAISEFHEDASMVTLHATITAPLQLGSSCNATPQQQQRMKAPMAIPAICPTVKSENMQAQHLFVKYIHVYVCTKYV